MYLLCCCGPLSFQWLLFLSVCCVHKWPWQFFGALCGVEVVSRVRVLFVALCLGLECGCVQGRWVGDGGDGL